MVENLVCLPISKGFFSRYHFLLSFLTSPCCIPFLFLDLKRSHLSLMPTKAFLSVAHFFEWQKVVVYIATFSLNPTSHRNYSGIILADSLHSHVALTFSLFLCPPSLLLVLTPIVQLIFFRVLLPCLWVRWELGGRSGFSPLPSI